jgi:ribonuclease HI
MHQHNKKLHNRLASYKHHLHKDLLHHTDQLQRAKDAKELRTHICKVKSHTIKEENESADTVARAAVDGEASSGITFDDADPLSEAYAPGHK